MGTSLRNVYLFAYNVCQIIGWTVALCQGLQGLHQGRSLADVYLSSADTVATFQLISVLEILHSALGLVGGSPWMNAMQWAGRSNILWGIVRSVPEVQNSSAVGVMILAWATSEIIRYPWYAAGVLGLSPGWLTWIRYSAFIPLYPIGVVGEMMATYQALPLIKARNLHSLVLPNAWNLAFDYSSFMMVVMLFYPFLWWSLYSTLLRQRVNKLGGGKRTAGRKRD